MAAKRLHLMFVASEYTAAVKSINEEKKMREQMWAKRSLQIWTVFGVVLAALICSAIVGTQTVRAAGACTTAQCNNAYAFAFNFCLRNGHGQLRFLVCPVSSETDDFIFVCNDNHSEQRDCATFGPS
jgi:hypothetical protein